MDKLKEDSEGAIVLSNALVKAWLFLGLEISVVSNVVGLPPNKLKNMADGKYTLYENSEEWGRAVAFLRFYRSLAGMLDENQTLMNKWLSTYNADFGKAPIEVLSEGGIDTIVGYFDSMHGRLY